MNLTCILNLLVDYIKQFEIKAEMWYGTFISPQEPILIFPSLG